MRKEMLMRFSDTMIMLETEGGKERRKEGRKEGRKGTERNA
jgi:hypothetical protein